MDHVSKIAAILKAASYPELDIVARAQVVEGISGASPNSSMKLFGQSTSTLLGKIQEMCLKVSPNVSPTWWDRRESGLYKAAVRGASKIHAVDYNPDDLLQGMLMGIGRSGDAVQVTFHWIGKKIESVPVSMERFSLGKMNPNDPVLTNMAMSFAFRKAQSEAKILGQENKKRDDSTEGTGDAPVSDILGGDTWSTILESALESKDSDADVIKWLRKIFSQVGTKGGQTIMSAYLDMVEGGAELWGIDVALAAKFGFAQTYLSRMKKEMIELAARLITSKKSEFAGFLDAIEDKKFYRSLEQGRPVLASDKKLRGELIRLCYQNPVLRPHLLPLITGEITSRLNEHSFGALIPRGEMGVVAENLTEKATYNTEKFSLTLEGNKHPFDQVVMGVIQGVTLPIKMLNGKSIQIPTQIVDSSTSPELSLTEIEEGVIRETILTLEVPVGHKGKYFAEIQSALRPYGFKIKEIPAFRTAEPISKSASRIASMFAENLFSLDTSKPGWEVATQRLSQDIDKAVENFRVPGDYAKKSPKEAHESVAHEVAELWTNKVKTTLNSYAEFDATEQTSRKKILDKFLTAIEAKIGFKTPVALDTYIVDVG